MLRPSLAFVLVTVLAAAQAGAEPTDATRTAVIGLWDKAISDWSPLLTCSAVQGDTAAFITDYWTRSRDQALADMAVAGWAEDALASLRLRSDPTSMILPMDTPFGEVIDYCRANGDWAKQATTFRVTDIGREVAAVLQAPPAP